MKRQSKRRSLLFVPTIDSRYYKSALTSETDTIIYDLEDSVPAASKVEARGILANLFPKQDISSIELGIRINHPETPFYHDDLALVKELKPHCVFLPKTEYYNEVQDLENFLSRLDSSETDPIDIIAIIETPIGFYQIREILSKSRRITAIALGVDDLTSEMGIEVGKLAENPIINRMQIEMAILSHMHELQCLGPVTRGHDQEDHLKILEQECKYLKKMNVKGKLAIHPSQIGVINQVFDITIEQIEEAKRVVLENKNVTLVKKANKFFKYAEQHGFSQ